MSNPHLGAISAEERAVMLQKAAEAKAKKREESINIIPLIDSPYHRELAKLYGVRMPNSYCQAHELKYTKRVAKKLDVDVNVWVKDVVGAKNLSEVAKLNPNIGACGMVGLLLEWAHELKREGMEEND